jgi:hypothetical protein
MTLNIPHPAHPAYDIRNCHTRTRTRNETEPMLRDIAFVLKLTERVRQEIKREAKPEA